MSHTLFDTGLYSRQQLFAKVEKNTPTATVMP